MTCWICREAPAHTDEHGVDWCAEHVNILKEAWDATGDSL